MIKVGFIDYYLDEWHANEYPGFLKKQSDNVEVICAYGHIQPPIAGRISNEEWSAKKNIPLAGSIEEVIEKSDCLVVLSPDNPEMHEELCKLPLSSGKLTYVDKTFATTKAEAERIFENADKHGTKCYSSSALFFADEYCNAETSGICTIQSMGPGLFSNYAIHQVEPIVKLMGTDASRVMCVGTAHPGFVIEYRDGRQARFSHFGSSSFGMGIGYGHKPETTHITVASDFFGNCIKSMVRFFETGEIPVPHENTIKVIESIEAARSALEKPFEWVDIL